MTDPIAIPKPSPIFRQAAMLRLGAAGQPDGSLALLSPGRWLALAATLIVFSGLGVWAWKGAVLRTVSAQGILARPGGVVNVDAPDAGQVLSLEVKPGDRVSARQVVAKIGNPLLAEQVRLAQEALAAAERDAERRRAINSAAARLEDEATDRRKRDLEREVRELESQADFSAEQAATQQKLFEEGLATRSASIAAQQKVVEIRAEIARRLTQGSQLDVERFRNQAALETADAESRELSADAARRLEELRARAAHSSMVVAPRDGQVIETRSYAGAMVAPGTPLVTLQPLEQPLEAVVYLPSRVAKQLEPGMEAQLQPADTRSGEGGFLRGAVAAIAEFPASPVALLRRFENETFASSISGQGPVTEVRIALRQDASDPSGYEWSARRSARTAVSSGTLCSARIVIVKQRPLGLVAPWIKETAGVN
jgi:HlyD family secretion protein